MAQVFESDACRVWTGVLGAPLHVIEDADQAQLDLTPCSLQIWINTSPMLQGIHLVNSADLSLPRPSVLLPGGKLSCLSIYSPSPFASSVLVVVDIDDTFQQGYFFDRVRQVATTSSLENVVESQPDGFFEAGVAVELLAVLHSAFPKVPLSNAAKECLAKRSTNQTTSGARLGKRRKTLSAEAFYGKKTLKPSPTSDSSVSSSAWDSFYEKLQFRVSHSLLCQLEGTAPILSSFPRQQEAFEFADQLAAFRRRLQSNRGGNISSGVRANDVPRVFSFENAADGKRRFLVASFAEFWKNYKNTRADQRHVYEIIRDGVPCRLYFDLEFKRSINPHVDGDALVARLISLLQLQLYRRYRLFIRHQDIYQLESTTPAKFSRHLIFHFPRGYLFADNIHAGAFVREFISDLVISSDQNVETSEELDNYTPFLVNTESVDDPEDKKQLFIDTGVYTRNRMFRVMGSSKHKKRAILRPTSTPTSTLTELDQELFIKTLVCPYPSLAALNQHHQLRQCRLLRYDLSPAAINRSRRFTSVVHGSKSLSSSSVECRSSMFPKLDAYIRGQATTGGVQGEIRSIQMLMTNASASVAVLPGQEDGHTEEVYAKKPPHPWMIIYHMARNRWCANIRRPHKSNNVMFIVDIDQRVFYQKCHDPRCQAIDFRSPPKPLPTHIKLDNEASDESNPVEQ